MSGKIKHEDDGESYDASDDGGTPHVGRDDEAALYAEQLDQLAAAGFTADGAPERNTIVGAVGPPVAGGGLVEHAGPTIVGE